MSVRPVNLRDNATISAAARQGIEIQTEKKWAAGSNKQHANPKNINKLDEETEDFHHATIPLDVGRLIMQGRQDANLTQKELATKINEKPQLERALGIKLRGKDKGAPLNKDTESFNRCDDIRDASPDVIYAYPNPPIRPEADEITAKNIRAAGSLGRMAGFVDDLESSRTTAIRRLRSKEAHEISQRMTQSTDGWCDFDGNRTAISAVQRAPRLGASLEAKEIMRSQTQKCDWFAPDIEPVSIRPKSTRPSTAQAGTLSCDWFAHGAANPPKADARCSFRRVRGEGKAYALQNGGCKDLLKTAPPDNPALPLYRCPTKESQCYCRQNKESKSVAECLRTCTLNDVPSRKARKEDTSIRSTIGASNSPGSAEVLQSPNKAIPTTQMARCITQVEKDAPPTPRRQMLSVSDEARQIYQKSRDGQMGHLIGKDAVSTILNYPSKNQTKAVNSEEAIQNQERARGNALRALITHSDLTEPPLKRQIRHPHDQMKCILGESGSVESGQPLPMPPRRLPSAEARCFADRQRGNMQDLLT
ncbi:hypothetical protein TcWFU_008785 [Taenia crassiceps]|uniref:Multiprotein bridging factor 1 N-terminal domain-containing protein n=1 Tax=Taenia crassiceps TaxID=6207 RepID=A0ABR4QV24_9CEST